VAEARAQAVIQRRDNLAEEHRLWVPHWQELADYIQPRKSNIAFQRSPAAQQTDLMFDSTAPHALELLGASMQGALTSSAFKWFGYRIRGVELTRDSELTKLLAACDRDSADAIQMSNWESESHEAYLDLPCFGTTAVLIEEAPPMLGRPAGQLRFTTMRPGEFIVDEDANGRVNTVYRTFKLSARAAAREFGLDKVGRNVAAAAEQNPGQRFEFIHAIYPREDAGIGRMRLPAPKKPIGSVWVSVADQVVMREGGFDEWPVPVPRWTKSSGETYGRGPGTVALPHIKTLNKAVELKLKMWAKKVDPPVTARDEGVLGQMQLWNGGITYVRDNEAIKVLDLAGDVNGVDLMEEKMRAEIRRMFFSDQLQLQEGPQMTAYEVQVRYELMQRVLGPTMGRVKTELLDPTLERIWWIRLRASGPNSPYRLVEQWTREHGVPLDIEYEGPLAKAQRLQDSISMQRFWQIVLPITQVQPDIMDKVDLDKMLDIHAVSVGVPPEIIRTAEAAETIRAARRQAQEEQAQQEQLVSAAKAAKDVAPLLAAQSQLGGGTGIIPPGAGTPAITRG
jgi:hypothetical protein